MDIITYALCKPSVGLKKEERAITFDGNETGKEVIPAQMFGYEAGNFVKVSDTPIENIEAFTLTFAGESTKYGKNLIQTVDFGSFVRISAMDKVLIGVVRQPIVESGLSVSVGVYVYCYSSKAYISEINYIAEVIDPKYLPEPVKINLADYDIDIVSATLAGGGTWVVYRPDFWDVVHSNGDRDIRFIANMDGVDYQLFPSVIAGDKDDLYGNMAMNLLACMNNVIVNANVVFIHYVDEGELVGVKCCVTVTQTPVPA